MIIRRRTNPPQFTNYTRFKPILREDFIFCCAYCASHESVFGSLRNMTIDHFRPKARFAHLLTAYSNLYYCCGECNTYKGDRWPTDEESAKDLRFVDVCADDPADHFSYVNAEIIPRTKPGRFTVASLRLDRPALTARRRDIAHRFHDVVEQLARFERIRTRQREIGGEVDPGIALEFMEIERALYSQLRQLIFPEPLSA